jgi:hypothetical protein
MNGWQAKRSTMKTRLVAIIAVIILLTGCSQSPQSGNPDWVDQLIKKIESEPVGNPPQSIWRYEFNSQVVYYVPAQCCDMYSTLYDATGNVICAPDGGLTGKGDGRCTDFYTHRTNEQLVWQDPR